VLAVRWYLRYGLSYRDVEELLVERGVQVDHVSIFRWVQGAVALAEGGHGRRPFVRCSDGEREFGESCGDPVVRVEVDG
jgi:hypothetical protein